MLVGNFSRRVLTQPCSSFSRPFSTVLRMTAWKDLVPSNQLSVSFTLTNGQCFGWRNSNDVFTGVLGTQALSLREANGCVQYACHNDDTGATAGSNAGASSSIPSSPGIKRRRESLSESDAAAGTSTHSDAGSHTSSAQASSSSESTALELALRDYFHLHIDIGPLYAQWAAADSRMSSIVTHLPAMRLLRQAPWECLLSFICSSNNNIPRITQMLDKIRSTYGQHLCTVDGRPYYSFPSPEALASAPEADLRALGLGYRAKYVRAAAAKVVELGGEGALLALRSGSLESCRSFLQQFDGVGPKVADCVALFSCDQYGAIPVDTHVWSIACCYYDGDGSLAQAKSLTPTVYDRVGSLFRSRFAPHAGWAHCLLFAAELPSYRALLPPDLSQDMTAFRAKEKEAKAVKKAAVVARKKAKLEGAAGAGAGASSSAGAADGSGAGGLDASFTSLSQTSSTGLGEDGDEEEGQDA